MRIARIVLAVFSPTESGLTVGKTLAEEFRCPYVIVNLTDPGLPVSMALSSEEMLIAVLPCSGGELPEIGLRRLMHITGNGSPAVAAVTFGGRNTGNSVPMLSDVLLSCGFVPIAAAEAVCAHEAIPGFGAGRPNIADIGVLRSFAMRVRSKLRVLARSEDGMISVPPVRAEETERLRLPRPTLNGNCAHCGTCVKRCPVQAIDEKDPSVIRTQTCIRCMRCVYVCPEHARSLPTVYAAMFARLLKAEGEGEYRFVI